MAAEATRMIRARDNSVRINNSFVGYLAISVGFQLYAGALFDTEIVHGGCV